MGDLTLFLPELVVFAAALVAFMGSAFSPSYRVTWTLVTLVSAGAVVATAAMLHAEGEPFFPGIYHVDLFSQLMKLGLTGGLLLTLLISAEMPSVRSKARHDVPFFLTLGTLGMMILVSATELLTLFVGLELSAYALYVLVALHRRQRMASEGAAKYLLYGAAASALTLYGLSLMFGATGSTLMSDLVAAPLTPLFVVGLVLALSGLLFKLAVLPFHAWAPDTYEAAPHQAAAFVASASKVAAVAILVRVLTLAVDRDGDGGAEVVQTLLVALAVVTMTVGNLAALAQKDLKRLLAWSTVAHAGYVLLGLMTLSELGFAAALFYALIYLLVAFGAFVIVCAVGRDGDNPTMDDLAGLYRRAPLLGVLLLAAMFGLAGVPPTPGFAGKWFLFSAAMDGGYFAIVLIGAVNATISLYYYLRVVRAAYQTTTEAPPPLPLSLGYRLATWATLGLITFTGVYPGPLWELCEGAARAVLGG